MLDEICARLNNYFCERKDRHKGTFKVVDGSIEPLAFLKYGQFFRIKGSTFNDGVWQYGIEDELYDEEFEGEIWAMDVPPNVVLLSQVTIPNWISENKAALDGVYQSESFGNYSYTLKSGASADGSGSLDWWGKFYPELKRHKKVTLL